MGGNYRSNSKFWYMTAKRDMSLKNIMDMFRRNDNISAQILQIFDSVEYMENIGFVHLNLSSKIIF